MMARMALGRVAAHGLGRLRRWRGDLQGNWGERRLVVGSFTTAAAPSVEAETGSVGGVTSTSAMVSGMVNPDGLADG
jgi:hypothetical protein